jgi:hypothetical protein
MRLPKLSPCGVCVIAALLFLATAATSQAQNSPPPAPAGQPAPQSPSQTPPASAQPPTPASSVAASDASQPAAVNSHGPHTVTVTFDYDFRVTRACTKKITQNCVQRFVAYDISAGAGHASMLFPIPLPAKPVGLVHGIVATSPKLDFESGQHLISVIAQGPDGKQSRKSVCTTWVTIP